MPTPAWVCPGSACRLSLPHSNSPEINNPALTDGPVSTTAVKTPLLGVQCLRRAWRLSPPIGDMSPGSTGGVCHQGHPSGVVLSAQTTQSPLAVCGFRERRKTTQVICVEKNRTPSSPKGNILFAVFPSSLRPRQAGVIY